MTTVFTNQTKNSASFSNQTKNSAVFGNISKSNQTVFGDLTYDQVGALAYDGMFLGRPVGDWKYNDLVGDFWNNQTKN
jgi:hypothetical protein